MSNNEITIAFLDVGQGDSCVIILPDKSSAVVVDCPYNKATTDYLVQKKINDLYVFLTHTDVDHMGGIADLVRNFDQVSLLSYNHDTFLIADDESKRKRILRELGQQILMRGLNTNSPRLGHTWNFQGVELEVLHPDDSDLKITVARNDTNNASTVLKVTFEQKKILLTADIEGYGWQKILDRKSDLKADILKFPHHGSWYKPTKQEPSLEMILGQIEPNFVILSVGSHNGRRHPNAATFKFLKKRAHIRLMCTEATPQCHSLLNSMSGRSLPCAGSIEITINKKEININPDVAFHSKLISSLDNAQCRKV